MSLQDADILASYGIRSKSILEFGCGGSTQIFAQCKPEKLISIETDPAWIDITKRRLMQVTGTPVTFIHTVQPFIEVPDMMFDLIFVDGIDPLRGQFAIETWKKLMPNGVMIFHDTRRHYDFHNVAFTAHMFLTEVSRIDVNVKASCGNSSNISIIHKKEDEPYVNWRLTEGKPMYAYGDPLYNGPLF